MNHTKELLLKIKTAILDGRLPVGNIPIADIRECVADEIQLHSNVYAKEQYAEIKDSFRALCERIPDNEQDRGRILLWMDALILSLNMISESVYGLADGDYFRYKHRNELDDPEIRKIIEYIDKEHRIEPISYYFDRDYDALPVEIRMDEKSRMKYVPYKGRKMFFPRGWEEQKITNYYRSVLREQDEKSPHCYGNTEIGGVAPGDVVVDAGAAEGIFALDIIDKAGKVYLVESESKWVEALEQTFRDDGDKVQIIHGFLDAVHEGDYVSIDGLFGQGEINFIKMDIEGAEKQALKGAFNTLQRCRNVRCAICAYHCREDEEWLKNTLESLGFETEVSKGYMCPNWTVEAYLDAELRRAIVFGRKK